MFHPNEERSTDSRAIDCSDTTAKANNSLFLINIEIKF